MGMWREIQPLNLPRNYKDHPWLFAAYLETPSDRDDGGWYELFLFRNSEWTTFGIKEYIGAKDWHTGHSGLPHNDDFRRLATKVIVDKRVRESLTSDDPDLPKLWKRH